MTVPPEIRRYMNLTNHLTNKQRMNFTKRHSTLNTLTNNECILVMTVFLAIWIVASVWFHATVAHDSFRWEQRVHAKEHGTLKYHRGYEEGPKEKRVYDWHGLAVTIE